MAIYSKQDISPIQSRPPLGGGDQQQDQQQDQQDTDQLGQSIEDKLEKRQDLGDDEFKQKSQRSQPLDSIKDRKTELKPVDTASVKPKYSWKELIRQFVSSAVPPQSTYTKPSRRAATQISIAQQIGAAAIKPGEKPGEDIFKLLMVFDSSGSMSGIINRALAETQILLKTSQSSLDPVIGITFFSDHPIYYAANLKTNQAWIVDTFKDLEKSPQNNQKTSLNSVLTSAMGGGTNFSNELSDQLSLMIKKEYNVIIFSDRDILWNENWSNFINLYKSNLKKIFFIADSSETFNLIVSKLGIIPRTFGHF